MSLRVHDISVPVRAGMLISGRQPEYTQLYSIAEGAEYNVSAWRLHAHTGTHVETGRHYVDGRETIDSVAIERLVGPARVLDLTAVAGEEIGPEDLRAAGYAGQERVLLKTANSAAAIREDEKRSSWVGLGTAAAEHLIESGTKLLGVDYLSVETPAGEAGGDWPVHMLLCGAGLLLLEVVDLDGIEPGDYLLACLPLKLEGGEAAPARVVLIEPPTKPSELWWSYDHQSSETSGGGA
ncbi:MAG: cyclase family protein [Solirubrobacterales bacterium]